MMAYEKAPNRRPSFRLGFMDVLIILLVILFILGGVIRIGRTYMFGDAADLGNYEIRFAVTDIAATSETAFVVGDTFRLTGHELRMGTLLSIESILPTEILIENEDHDIFRVPYPKDTRIDVIGVLSSFGRMGESGFLLDGKFLLSPGISYKIQSEHMNVTLKILEISPKTG